jgi:hypothetical protein
MRHRPVGSAASLLDARLSSLIEDAFDLAPVDVELASYSALAVSGLVPDLYRLLPAWRFGESGVVRHRPLRAEDSSSPPGCGRNAGSGLRSDQRH